jgi:hypothetical protein
MLVAPCVGAHVVHKSVCSARVAVRVVQGHVRGLLVHVSVRECV